LIETSAWMNGIDRLGCIKNKIETAANAMLDENKTSCASRRRPALGSRLFPVKVAALFVLIFYCTKQGDQRQKVFVVTGDSERAGRIRSLLSETRTGYLLGRIFVAEPRYFTPRLVLMTLGASHS
jgi:hypothetical protein